MSNVKSNNGPAGLWNAITKEAGRVVSEAGRHVTESFNDVAKGVEKGGVLGGIATAADKFSPGNIATGVVDSMFPGADLPKPLAEGISAAVNIAAGNPMGLVDIAQGFMAIAGDGGKSSPANDGKGQRMQTPESPSNAVNHPPTPGPAPTVRPSPLPTFLEGGVSVSSNNGNTVLRMGPGNDTVDLRKLPNGNVRVTVNGESFTLSAKDAEKLVIAGGKGNDRITVGPGIDNVKVNGGAGHDTIVIHGDNATAYGKGGNDTIRITGDGGVLDGGSGHDKLSNFGDNARLVGGGGNDKLTNFGDNGVLLGGNGNDKLNNRGDNGVLLGGKGNDALTNRGDNGRMIGGPGRDTTKQLPALPPRLSILPHRPEHDLIYTNFPMPPPRGLLPPPSNALPSPTPDQACDHNEFIGRCGEKLETGTGYASVLDQLDGFFAINDLLNGGKASDTAKKKLQDLEGKAKEATSELDKILNNPNLSFEDMIFMLMTTLMKQSQAEVKEMTKEIRNQKAEFETKKTSLNADFDAAEAKVLGLEDKLRAKPDDKDLAKQLGEAKSALRKAGEERNDKFSEFNDSRQEQLEALKNAMNKITEMQQALSNVLNSMHQTAMNTIGNIR